MMLTDKGSPKRTLTNNVSASVNDYELILRSIGEGVNVLDAGGCITFVNPSASQMLGFSAEELVGQEQHSLLHHSRADGTPFPDSECPILAAVRDGKVRRQDNDVFWRKDGTSFPVDYIATPIHHGAAIIGAVVAFRDATERRPAEELNRLTQSLSRINRELDQFAYIASHDLKAPLRGIASLATWIEEDAGPTLSHESRQHLTLLRTRIRRMEALIDGLLQYSRAGRVRSRVEEVNLGDLLKETVDMLSPLAEAQVEIASEMPTLNTERLPLQQVFLNLIGNALKHSGRPDSRVRVAIGDANDFFEFTVTDNGPGIPTHFQSRVWEIFQTLQPRDKVEGAGIGLALVKKYVESRGGKVWLQSDDSRGAEFGFSWPKHLDDAES